MTLKSDSKFEEKLILGSKNDIRNLVNFNASSGKFENVHFVVLLLLKIYYVLVKKSVEELCVITLKNDTSQLLVLCKMAWGIWWTLPEHSKKLKFAL